MWREAGNKLKGASVPKIPPKDRKERESLKNFRMIKAISMRRVNKVVDIIPL